MVEKLFPAFIPVMAQMDMNDRVAPGLNRFMDEFHVGLRRCPPTFFNIAFHTGTDNIPPRGDAPHPAGNDMVQR